MYFGSIQQTTNAGDFYFANQNTTNVELMRVKSTGQVLIGTQSPIDTGNATAKLQVVADVGGGGATPNSGNALVLGQRTNGADKAGVAFGLAADNGGESTNACTLDIFTATSGSLSKRMSINSGGDVDIVNGNLVFETSGKGIDFSATSGSGTSELFDDYEEGSGTPTVSFQTSGSLTLGSSQTFKYVKIGDLVTFSFEFQVASTTNPSGAIKIDLPFSSGTGVYSAGAVRLYGVTFTGSPYLEISPSLSYVLVQSSVSGTVTSPINGTGYYFGTISYRTTG
jgi:ribosomal protein L30E